MKVGMVEIRVWSREKHWFHFQSLLRQYVDWCNPARTVGADVAPRVSSQSDMSICGVTMEMFGEAAWAVRAGKVRYLINVKNANLIPGFAVSSSVLFSSDGWKWKKEESTSVCVWTQNRYAV